MKKTLRKVLSLALALAFALSLGAAAAPEGPALSVVLNGQPMSFTDAQPVLKDGRVYVPYRAVFEALGAEVSYAASAKTVSAQRGDTTVVFAVGANQVVVTENGKSETVQVDAAPYIDEASGRTMVPVRFAAQALGAGVGWDKETKTAQIIDVKKLEQTYGGKFALMDRYIKDSADLQGAALSFSGKLNLNLSVRQDGQLIPVAMTGVISGGSDQKLANMKANFSLELDQLLKELGSQVSAEDQSQLDKLKNMEINYIVNLNTGMLYFNAPVLAEIGAAPKADTWYSASLNEFYKETLGLDIDFAALLQDKQSLSTCQTLLQSMTAGVDMDDPEAYQQLTEALNACENLLGDKAFVKNGDTYTSKTSLSQNGGQVSFQLDLKENQGKLSGLSMDLNVSEEENQLTMKVSQDAKTVSMVFQLQAEAGDDSSVSMDCDYSIEYSPLQGKLEQEPPAGADVRNLNELVKGPSVTMTNEKVGQ